MPKTKKAVKKKTAVIKKSKVIKKSTAIAITKKKENELSFVQSQKGVMPIKDVQKMMAYEIELRKLVTQYIKFNLKDKLDYGAIEMKTKNGGTIKTKPVLFKSGTEKFTSLFKLKPKFHKDSDTWEMSGSKQGLYCYVCELVNLNGEIVAEGRGACTAASKSGDDNNAIKIAQKRAQTDAVLRQGALSDFFTQDLEDNVPSNNYQKTTTPPPPVKTINHLSDLVKYLANEAKVVINDGKLTGAQLTKMIDLYNDYTGESVKSLKIGQPRAKVMLHNLLTSPMMANKQ